MQNTDNVFDAILKINTANAENKNLKEVDIMPDPTSTLDEDVRVKRNGLRDRNKLWHTRDIAYTFNNNGKYGTKQAFDMFQNDAMPLNI